MRRSSTILPSLYFQQLPTIKFCNHCVLITIQNGPGVYPTPLFATVTGALAIPPLSLSSITYELPNLQDFCFDNVATVGGGGGYPLPRRQFATNHRLQVTEHESVQSSVRR